MEELLSYRQELFSVLKADIPLLARIEVEISYEGWFRRLGDDQPTAHYVLARLWAEDAHGFTPQIRRILDVEMPLLPVFDVDAWMAEHYVPEEPARIIIENFVSLHTWEVGLLCGLPPTSWSRAGRHPRWGVHALQWWVEQQRETSQQYFGQLLSLLDV
jgi:hypothetical protein